MYIIKCGGCQDGLVIPIFVVGASFLCYNIAKFQDLI